jgi:hypothetical protein
MSRGKGQSRRIRSPATQSLIWKSGTIQTRIEGDNDGKTPGEFMAVKNSAKKFKVVRKEKK